MSISFVSIFYRGRGRGGSQPLSIQLPPLLTGGQGPRRPPVCYKGGRGVGNNLVNLMLGQEEQ